MAQMYVLSILMNLMVGMILVTPASDKQKFFTNEVTRLICGAVCFLTALIKLFFTYGSKGAGIPVLGDLIPAVAGIAGGASVLIEYYLENHSAGSVPEIVETILVKNKLYIGILCLGAAVLHFIMPGVIIF
ncbi:MAG: hypothetical protein MJ169_05790 [Treponema sp.]|nr:hypothetical protein [Treponema sp.]